MAVANPYKKAPSRSPTPRVSCEFCVYWLTPSIARMRKLEATLLPSFFSRSA
jgi:hypothetical protein